MANYHYLTPTELVQLLDDEAQRDSIAIVDCRDDDRNEGFIPNSIHAPTALYTDEMYRALAKGLHEDGKKMAVFHCALSQVRGPKGANRFALAQKASGYTVPDVFVLRGGWEAFYCMFGESRPDLCIV